MYTCVCVCVRVCVRMHVFNVCTNALLVYSVGVPNCTYSTKRNVKVNARWRLDGPGTCTEVIYF